VPGVIGRLLPTPAAFATLAGSVVRPEAATTTPRVNAA
jgi:hypothetical protein